MDNLLEINKQLSSQDLFVAFKMQLIKDFEQSNFSAEVIRQIKPNYYGIHSLLASILQHNEFSTQHNIMQLVYRIDISETQLKKYLKENKDESYYNVLAELIIKRVLQKVVTKQYYKNYDSN